LFPSLVCSIACIFRIDVDTGLYSESFSGRRLAATADFTAVCASVGIVAPVHALPTARRVYTASAASATSLASKFPGGIGRMTRMRAASILPSAFVATLNDRSSPASFELDAAVRRTELGAAPLLAAVPPDTPICDVGSLFPFMNRLNECKEHLRALADLNDLRGVGDWESHKRRLLVPTFIGMPGSGKSRFARESIKHLIDAFGSVAAVVDAVWLSISDEERVRRIAFVSQLLAASSHRNLRLALCGSHACTERSIALELLVDWMGLQLASCSAASVADPTARCVLQDGLVTCLLDKDSLRHHVAHGMAALDVLVVDVLQFVAGSTASPLETAILVNLDEAQQLPQRELMHVLELILSPLLQRGVGVFLSVSGLNSEQLFQGMDSSGARMLEIICPVSL
jgi:hypothetical protein